MDFQSYAIARALHVFAVVIWIGGVAFVTTVLIPALRNTQTEENRLHLFELLESKFSFQAKFTTLLAGITGFYMVDFVDGWSTMGWWIHLMIFVWAIFTMVLFVLEPLFLHQWFREQALKNNERCFFVLQMMHIILLSISLLAVLAGVAMAHGFSF